MQRSHVAPVSGEFFDVDRVSEVPKISEMHFGILEVVIHMLWHVWILLIIIVILNEWKLLIITFSHSKTQCLQ